MTNRQYTVTVCALLALYVLLQGLTNYSEAQSAKRQCPTVTCSAGKSPVVTVVDGGWLVRCEVRR
jgi:hypothetical protein